MEKHPFKTYNLDANIFQRASVLYPRVRGLTGPNTGFDVPSTALAPICALLACEELGSTSVTEHTAQVMACLRPQEWARALRNARAAVQLAPATTPRKDKGKNVVKSIRSRDVQSTSQKTAPASDASSRLSKSSSILVIPNLPRQAGQSAMSLASSSKSTVRTSVVATQKQKRHTFFTLCRRYRLEYDELSGAFDTVYAVLGNQGWNREKWAENETTIRVAVFLWVCELKNKGLRDVRILAEELSVPLKLLKSIVESLNSIKPTLSEHLEIVEDTSGNNQLTTAPPASGSRDGVASDPSRSSSPMEKADAMVVEGEGSSERDLSPPAKRRRTGIVFLRSPPRQTVELAASERAATSRVERASTVPELAPTDTASDEVVEDAAASKMDVDGLQEDTNLEETTTVSLMHRRSTRTTRTELVVTETVSMPQAASSSRPKRTSSSPTKSLPNNPSPSKSSTKRDSRKGIIAGDDGDDDAVRQPKSSQRGPPTRYRPVFPDRAFYDLESEDEEVNDAWRRTREKKEQHALDAWMKKTRVNLGVAQEA